MDTLKQKLESLGLSEDMSQQAIDTVLEYIKGNLPENIQGLIDSAVKGEMPDVGGLLDKAKDIFGG